MCFKLCAQLQESVSMLGDSYESMFWLAKAQEERNTDVDIRAQLAARVFLHEVMEGIAVSILKLPCETTKIVRVRIAPGLTSWPDLLPGLSDAVLQYLHAILTYEAWQSLVGTLWTEFLGRGSAFGGTGCCKEPCAARAPSKMAGTTGIMSASRGYSVKAQQLRQGMSCEMCLVEQCTCQLSRSDGQDGLS